MHKRNLPYIANLSNIDSYLGISPSVRSVEYPINSCKAEAIFDFEKFYRKKGIFYL